MSGKLQFVLSVVLVTGLIFAVREVVKRFVIPQQQDVSSLINTDPSKSPFHIASAAVGNNLEGNFVFTDQDGARFDVKTWFDKPMVVSFVFTNCPVICPAITSSLSKVVKENKERFGKDFRILTISFDIAKDTPDVMKKFGHNFTEDFANWKFLTGSAETVKSFADRLGIVFKPDDAGGFLHTIGVTVVEPGGIVSAQVFGPQYSSEDILLPVDTALGKK
ncbi:MAG: SCO family protein [Nitrospinae bacterium]|nr:SCO family protein [Nitrospinota bacterium]MBF0634460.1 SCO family protein [Nitrospinota bacterium]